MKMMFHRMSKNKREVEMKLKQKFNSSEVLKHYLSRTEWNANQLREPLIAADDVRE